MFPALDPVPRAAAISRGHLILHRWIDQRVVVALNQGKSFGGDIYHGRRIAEPHSAQARLQSFPRLNRSDQLADDLRQLRMFGAFAGGSLKAPIDRGYDVRAAHGQYRIEEAMFGSAVDEGIGEHGAGHILRKVRSENLKPQGPKRTTRENRPGNAKFIEERPEAIRQRLAIANLRISDGDDPDVLAKSFD
jgi:hypothetical protein